MDRVCAVDVVEAKEEESELMPGERMRFLQSDGGAPVRTECFICAPKLKLDKEQRRVMVLVFSVKLDANVSNTCDEKIRRAFEDVTYLEREIAQVTLSSVVEDTDIEFYELPPEKALTRKPLVVLRDVDLVALYVERVKGQNYLYFQLELAIWQHGAIGHVFQDRFGTVLFGEFRASQQSLKLPKADGPVEWGERIKSDPTLLQAMAEMVSPIFSGNLDSLTISLPGTGESVTIDRERAVMITNAAKQAKRSGKSKGAAE